MIKIRKIHCNNDCFFVGIEMLIKTNQIFVKKKNNIKNMTNNTIKKIPESVRNRWFNGTVKRVYDDYFLLRLPEELYEYHYSHSVCVEFPSYRKNIIESLIGKPDALQFQATQVPDYFLKITCFRA